MKTARTALIIAATLITAAGVSNASHAADTHQKLECINLRDIDDSPVIDDRTILLKMKGGDYKRIDLAAPCTGIDYNGWSHRTGYDQLCSSDSLTVRAPGGGVCLIGHIADISRDEGHALMAKHEKR